MSDRVFEILIRRDKMVLDEKRRQLGVLEAEKAALTHEIEMLTQKIDQANAEFFNVLDYQASLSNFTKKCREEIKLAQLSILSLNEKIEQMLEEIRLAYGELRKLELALEARIENLKIETNRKEQKILDEIASQAPLRKGSL